MCIASKSPENKLLSGNTKKNLGKAEVDTLIREVGAGPATLGLLQELNNGGKAFEDIDDLIPALKKKNANATKDPVVARALAGANQSPAELDRSRDRELLQQHLAEGHLLDKAPVPKDPELDRLLADGKGLHPTKDLCDYLSDVDKEYPSSNDLEKKGFPEARQRREATKKEMKNMLNNPKKEKKIINPRCSH